MRGASGSLPAGGRTRDVDWGLRGKPRTALEARAHALHIEVYTKFILISIWAAPWAPGRSADVGSAEYRWPSTVGGAARRRAAKPVL